MLTITLTIFLLALTGCGDVEWVETTKVPNSTVEVWLTEQRIENNVATAQLNAENNDTISQQNVYDVKIIVSVVDQNNQVVSSTTKTVNNLAPSQPVRHIPTVIDIPPSVATPKKNATNSDNGTLKMVISSSSVISSRMIVPNKNNSQQTKKPKATKSAPAKNR